MLYSIVSPKGGTGCSVVSALFAEVLSSNRPTLLIDACNGDLEQIVNSDEKPRYSFHQWCLSQNPDTQSLEKIAIPIKQHLYLVASTSKTQETDSASTELIEHTGPLTYEKRHSIVDALSQYSGDCVVDLGQRTDLMAKTIIEASDVVIMTLKQCYLSLQGASAYPFISKVDATVVTKESGRSISLDQIADTLSLDVLIELQARRDYARAIDAGVLLYRTPANLRSPIESFVRDVNNNQAVQELSNDVFETLETKNNSGFWAQSDSPKTKISLLRESKREVARARRF